MAPEAGPTLLSHADYLLLPDEPRGEVYEGVFVVTPSPSLRHQLIADYITRQLGNWLDEHPEVGTVASAPLDVILKAERPAVILQPDVLFVSAERASALQDWVRGAPDLVVEVASPSTAGRDALTKRHLYARHGVREYWLVWPVEQRIDVFTAGPGGPLEAHHTLGPGDRLDSPLLPGLALDVARILAPRGPAVS